MTAFQSAELVDQVRLCLLVVEDKHRTHFLPDPRFNDRLKRARTSLDKGRPQPGQQLMADIVSWMDNPTRKHPRR